MKNPRDAKAAAAKACEDAFLTLLQRIQRQAQTANSSTTATASSKNTQLVVPAIAKRPRRAQQRPPDEAAAALGRQLALKFQALGVVVAPEEPTTSTKKVVLPQIPKSLQEKALQCLVHRSINPAIVISFLETLVPTTQNSTNPTIQSPKVQMEWLPAWILHAESVVLQDQQESHTSDYESSSFHALCSMIRTFGYYQLWCQRQVLHHQWTASVRRGISNSKNNYSTAATIQPHPQAQDVVATTFRRLQSAPARMTMIREWIQIAFLAVGSSPAMVMVPGRLGISDGHSSGNSAFGGGYGDNTGTGLLDEDGGGSGGTKNSAAATMGPQQLRRTRQLQSSGVSPRQVIQAMLSPLLAASVLTLENPMTESMMFMETLWRECWSEMTTWCGGAAEGEEIMDIKDGQEDYLEALEWLTQALNIYLVGLPCYLAGGSKNKSYSAASDQLAASKELAMRWLLQLLELASFLVQTFQDNDVSNAVMQPQHRDPLFPSVPADRDFQERLARWLSRVVAESVPRLFSVLPSYHVSLEAILIQILQILQRLSNHYYYPLRTTEMMETSNHHPSQKSRDHRPDPNRFDFLDTVATLRLAAVALSNPIPSDVPLLLQILHVSVTTTIVTEHNMGARESTASATSLAMLRGLASMLMRKDGCQTTCRELIHALNSLQNTNLVLAQQPSGSMRKQHKSSVVKKPKAARLSVERIGNVIQFLDHSIVDVDNFVAFLATENCLEGTQCTAMQQTGSLLLGIGLLLDHSQHQMTAYTFLGQLLEVYPHLGIALLPVIVDCINVACIKGDALTLKRQLGFICEAVVKDPQCAQEIWNLLGVQLMKADTTPSVIRASVIRLFPKLCCANKRLYKRIMEALGDQLATCSDNVEIRLAIAATIADLAKEDRIRDVTDVIGWIQGFITEISWIRPVSTLDDEQSGSKAALVHYAILALHYLLVAQELDFILVVVVLKKRLCNVHDMKEVTLLPPLVLESLILLLGDGECDDDEEEEEDEERTTLQPISVSPEVSKSVETLLSVALSIKIHTQRAKHDMLLEGTLLRCRRNIQQALSQYSVEALGIDDVGLHGLVSAASEEDDEAILSPSGKRYEVLLQVVQEGIQLLESNSYKMNPAAAGWGKDAPYTPDEVAETDISSSLASLIVKLLKFEEYVLGSTLWQKRGSRKSLPPKGRALVQGQVTADPSQREALPTAAGVQKIYNDNRCTATSLAVLLCFEGKPLSFFGDLAMDIVQEESADPLLGAFTVQAWLNATRSTLMELVVSYSSSEGLENILTEIREWRYRLDCPDNMFLALSSFALLIPDILGPYGDHSPYVNEICEEVWNGYSHTDFENEDIGKLCIGFVGVCALHNGSRTLLGDIIDALERSILGYGGQASFAAYYGLAIIAQACQQVVRGHGDDDVRTTFVIDLVARIASFLVNELILCVSGKHKALTSLTSCIKDRKISPAVIDKITALGKSSLTMVKSQKVTKSLFIALAISLPALAVVNDELLLGVYCLLDSIPWGYGKGVALSCVLQECKRHGLFKGREIDQIYAKNAEIFEEGMEKGVSGLDDIFYAVAATMTKTIPDSIRRFLVGNRNLFDEDGRAVSLLAAVVSLSSVPCLGCGAVTFTESAQLSPHATSEDITGVKTLLVEAVASREPNKYSQFAVLLLGFLASTNTFAGIGENYSMHSSSSLRDQSQMIYSKLPTAKQGTVLEVVMTALLRQLDEPWLEMNESSTNLIVKLLGCLEALSLPGQFASFLEQMFRGNDETKTACTKLLISQIQGRPRAVFDGRDYMDLALKMSKLPPTNIKTILGQGEAPILFVDALVDLVPKFPTDAVEEVVENFWRLCFNQVGNLPGMSVAFLKAMKALLKVTDGKKPSRISPKTVTFLRHFLVTRAFAGIRDAPWTSTSSSSTTEERSIVENYSDCLLEIPVTTLVDTEFFKLKELDGFIGEALRYRCVMVLVRKGYFTTQARASSEIASAIAWFSRQLTSSEEEIFSTTLLQVACSIADATAAENPDRRKELLLTLLDNLLLTGPSASYVGLQMLGVLVCRWVNGEGSDGDLSLACLISTQMDRWKELSPPTLQQTFRLLVHDLPFNLATYARAENMSDIIFNRLWRVYNKWFEQGAEKETIDCVRKALICCRTVDSASEDFASLATSMLKA